MRLAAASLCLLGCGRINFDFAQLDDGNRNDSAGVHCAQLAATCGANGSSPCCESLPVPSGSFYRSYDVGVDMQFPNMGYPATVSGFRLDKYEVTVGRFREFIEAGMGTQQRPPGPGAGIHPMIANSGWDPAWNTSLAATSADLMTSIRCDSVFETWTALPGGNESRPINCISWFEAMAFCAWDGGFLPTEAEWNYAAAGGSVARAYPWSNPASTLTLDPTYASYYDGVNCMGDGNPACTRSDLLTAGSKPLGDGFWGQSDLGGNVWEWVLDWSAMPYPTANCDDCANLTPTGVRVLRGGGFYGSEGFMRGATRTNARDPSYRFLDYGVRCARP